MSGGAVTRELQPTLVVLVRDYEELKFQVQAAVKPVDLDGMVTGRALSPTMLMLCFTVSRHPGARDVYSGYTKLGWSVHGEGFRGLYVADL